MQTLGILSFMLRWHLPKTLGGAAIQLDPLNDK